MALPIAHATAGYLLHRADRRTTAFTGWPRALTYMAIANLPDLDFLVGFALGRPGAFHRGVSHTVLAAVVFGMALALVTRWWWGERWLPASVAYAVVYASHFVVDAVTIDARGPVGAQFLWPFSEAYYAAPFTVFHEILVDGRTRLGFLASVCTLETVRVLARDLTIAAVALGGVHALELSLRRRRLAEAMRRTEETRV